MLNEGIVGNGRTGLADGAVSVISLGKLGEVLIDPAVADYWQSLIRARSFTASTGTGGVAPGTALSTTPPFVLYNPPNSGVIAAVLDAEVGFVSGTLGAGNVVLAGVGGQNITTKGTVLTPAQPNLIGSSAAPNCLVLQAPTLSVAPTLMRNLWYTGAFVTNATAYFADSKKDLRGLVGVMPGGAICLQEVGAAGTSPLVMFTMSWIEVPVQFSL